MQPASLPKHKLPVRLPREMARHRQRLTALLLSVLLLVIGGAALWGAQFEEGGVWLIYLVGGVFSAVGLLLMVAYVHQSLGFHVAETLFEVERRAWRAGRPAKFCVRQLGPAYLKSLRVNLICLQRDHPNEHRAGSEIRERLIKTINLLDARNVAIHAEEWYEPMVVFDLPADLTPTGRQGHLAHHWKIEIWGRVRHWPNFMHPFSIKILPAEEAEEMDI